MEKIYFDDETFIWKTKLNLSKDKNLFLNESKLIIDSNPESKTDGYGIMNIWKDDLNFLGETIN